MGIVGGTAEDLWTGMPGLRLVSTEGDDYTEELMKGAWEVLHVTRLAGATKAILHNGSPSCGVPENERLHDAEGNLVAGEGVQHLNLAAQAKWPGSNFHR